MKLPESRPSETALRRPVLAGIVAGIVVLIAIVAAPPMTDSIAMLDATASQVADLLYGDAAPTTVTAINVEDTLAVPVEPLSMYY